MNGYSEEIILIDRDIRQCNMPRSSLLHQAYSVWDKTCRSLVVYFVDFDILLIYPHWTNKVPDETSPNTPTKQRNLAFVFHIQVFLGSSLPGIQLSCYRIGNSLSIKSSNSMPLKYLLGILLFCWHHDSERNNRLDRYLG